MASTVPRLRHVLLGLTLMAQIAWILWVERNQLTIPHLARPPAVDRHPLALDASSTAKEPAKTMDKHHSNPFNMTSSKTHGDEIVPKQTSALYSLPPIDDILIPLRPDLDHGIHDDAKSYNKSFYRITDNVTLTQSLLHFAIIGFGKCGTTTLHQFLRTHPRFTPHLQTLENEVWALAAKDPQRLMRRLHAALPDPTKQRGYKCPGDVLGEYILDYYEKYFPDTKLLVGLRHPVWWFESLYNFRIQNFNDYRSVPPPNELIGVCSKTTKQICTRRGHFAYYLMRFGKQFRLADTANGHDQNRHPQDYESDPSWKTATLYQIGNQSLWKRPFTDLEERIARKYPVYEFKLEHLGYKPNPIFLFEVNQLGDTDRDRRRTFERDLYHFLELDHQVSWEDDGDNDEIDNAWEHVRPGRRGWNATVQAEKDALKIDICADQFQVLRAELMDLAEMASLWIRQVFLNQPEVSFSARDYLEELLGAWVIDPCTTKNVPVSSR